MTRSVFISHSSKPPDPAEPEPAPGTKDHECWVEQETIRAHRQVFYDLRTSLVDKLADESDLEAWVDDRKLGIGTDWRLGIHGALFEADAAVLLLSPEALRSPWVLKEATVLTVLESLGFPVAIIPVLLGLRDDEIEESTWGPLKLRNLQRVKVDEILTGSEAVGGFVDRIVDAVTERLDELKPDRSRAGASDFDLWAAKLSGFLANLDETIVFSLMKGIGASELLLDNKGFLERLRSTPWTPDADTEARRLVARELLLADSDLAVTELGRYLAGSNVDAGGMANLFKPAWVPAGSAADAPLVAGENAHALVVNARHPKIGAALVLRAHCYQLEQWRLISPDEPKDDPPADKIVEFYQAQVGGCVGGISKLASRVKPGEPVYVVIGHQVAGHDEALDELLKDEKLSAATFIIMGGKGSEARALAHRIGARLIAPTLPDNDKDPEAPDGDFDWFEERLNKIATA